MLNSHAVSGTELLGYFKEVTSSVGDNLFLGQAWVSAGRWPHLTLTPARFSCRWFALRPTGKCIVDADGQSLPWACRRECPSPYPYEPAVEIPSEAGSNFWGVWVPFGFAQGSFRLRVTSTSWASCFAQDDRDFEGLGEFDFHGMGSLRPTALTEPSPQEGFNQQQSDTEPRPAP